MLEFELLFYGIFIFFLFVISYRYSGKKKIIIGLGHKFGVGKDTVALYLQKNHGFEILRFANRIKVISSEITNTTLKQNYENKDVIITKFSNINKVIRLHLKDIYSRIWLALFYQELEISVRKITLGKFQQILGEKLRNLIGEDIFINFAKVDLKKSKSNKIVFCDMRFKNEALFIKTQGGKCIKIDRNWEDRLKYSNGRDRYDISETDLDDYNFDKIIVNNGEKQDLYKKILN